MALPVGGISDKIGNKYEYNYVVLSILKILTEEVEYLEYEPFGENATDIIQCINGVVSHQQCKIRNGSDECWTISSLSENVFPQWKTIFETKQEDKVALVSPIPFTKLQDVSNNANNYKNNPEDFLSEIQKLGKASSQVLEKFCDKMIGCYNPNENIVKIVDYLCKIEFINYSDNTLNEMISCIIKFLFVENEERVYEALYNWVSSGGIFRRKIYFNDVNKFIINNNLTLRQLSNNPKNIIAINKMNAIFKSDFEPFEDNKKIERSVSKEIYDIISSGDSCVIAGDAGVGKSGCMINLVEMCDKNHVPYVGIKLDKYIPINNTDEWGKSLGMICSPTYCLDAISKNSNAIIFLDQLDTLRWLQIENNNWMLVLESLLDEVKTLNRIRNNKISVVFSVRSYDLNYDCVIKKIINQNKCKTKIISPLTDEELKSILGSAYYNLTEQEKDLLSVPSNLFIWKQLNDGYKKTIFSTKKLIDVWIEQISSKNKSAIDGNSIKITIDKIVELYVRNKENKVLRRNLSDRSEEIKFLLHEKFLKEDENKENIYFCHQTIYDALLVDKKLSMYDKNKDICLIIGESKEQTPKNRYIMKMFLEIKLIENIEECLKIFNQILYNKKIRFSYRHLVIELLSKYKKQNDKVNKFVTEKIKDKMWGKYFIDEVVLGNITYVEYLIDIGLLDSWFETNENLVINVLRSIANELNDKCIAFIKKYLFLNEDKDKMIYKVLPLSLQEDNEKTYELRLLILSRYPQFSLESYFEMDKLFRTHFKRAIDILSLLIIHRIKIPNLARTEEIFNYGKDLEDDAFENGYMYALGKILPILPKEESPLRYEWIGYESNCFSLERLAVKCIKKANFYFIKNDSNAFFEIYKPYMNSKNSLFKEIILDALFWFDSKYSAKILEYLSTDFNMRAFDTTSECTNKLDLACKVIQKHTSMCDRVTYISFENTVMEYKDEDLVMYYKIRRKRRYEGKMYEAWCDSIWGKFQFKVLSCINENILSAKAKDLLNCLKRSFSNKNYFDNSRFHSGGLVVSPISNKKISVNQWKNIITNTKINNMRNRTIEVQGGFIESSLEAFSADFSDAVADNPTIFIEIMLKLNEQISDLYIDSFYFGLSKSKYLNELNEELLETIFTKFNGFSEKNIKYFLNIIKNKKTCFWSEHTYLAINEIFKKYGSSEEAHIKYDKLSDLHNLVINSVFGITCETIAHILSIDNSKIVYFEQEIDEYKHTDNIIKRFSLLFIMPYLSSKYFNDILEYCLENVHCIVVNGIRQRILQLYSKSNNKKIIKIIKLGLSSNDEYTQDIACWLLYNLYLKKQISFKHIINAKNKCPNAIMRYLLGYVKKCKNRNIIMRFIVSTFVNNSKELDHHFYTIFNDNILDYKKDEKFILRLIKCDNSIFLEYFIRSLEKIDDLFAYHKLIFKAAQALIVMNQNKYTLYAVNDDLFTCIITLYNFSIGRNDKIMKKCLDILDLMYEYKIGSARTLYLEMTK